MSGKRVASTELTHDNWDDEEETEEIGTFEKAPDEVIRSRVIKTARRRNVDSNKESAAGLFSGFTGFASKATTPTLTASSFSFLSNLTNGKIETPKTNGSSMFSNKIESLVKQSPVEEKREKESHSPDKPDEYYAKLKGLNQSVTQWIKSNVDENPFCILTPIFKDYEKYLSEIGNIVSTSKIAESPKASSLFGSPLKSTAVPTTVSQTSNAFQDSSFSTTPRAELKDDNKSTLFSFKADTPKPSFGALTSKIDQTKPSFSFGSSSSMNVSSSPFSFGIGKPLASTGPTTQSSESAKADDEENEDDSPPKVTFTPVVEENSVYNKRCKVFVKKENNYSDRGTATLYIKTVENSDKHQLIVRADTNLGNLLLNLILADSLPIQRMGKNNVMLVCIPTPDSKPPPVPVLIRVKTPEEADELFESLNKFKK